MKRNCTDFSTLCQVTSWTVALRKQPEPLTAIESDSYPTQQEFHLIIFQSFSRKGGYVKFFGRGRVGVVVRVVVRGVIDSMTYMYFKPK